MFSLSVIYEVEEALVLNAKITGNDVVFCKKHILYIELLESLFNLSRQGLINLELTITYLCLNR